MTDETPALNLAESTGERDPRVVPEVPPEHRRIDQLVERWFADHFHGSEVARYTPAWNCVQHAKEQLKRLLKESFSRD